MPKRCHVEETALEFAKTLISTDQPELVEDAEADGTTTADAVAIVAFELSEAFHREAERRNK